MQESLVDSQIRGGKTAEDDFLNIGQLRYRRGDGVDRYLGCELDGVAVDSGADARERNACDGPTIRDRQGSTIARGKEFWLSVGAAAPDRSDRMHNEFCGKPIRFGELGLADLATA